MFEQDTPANPHERDGFQSLSGLTLCLNNGKRNIRLSHAMFQSLSGLTLCLNGMRFAVSEFDGVSIPFRADTVFERFLAPTSYHFLRRFNPFQG